MTDSEIDAAGLMADGADGDTLLRYALLVEPDPLQTGGPATLTLVVSNPGRHAVDCALIVLTIPVGTGGKQLVADAQGLETQLPEGWQVSQSAGTLRFQPDAAHAAIGEHGPLFTISRLTINDAPGTARLYIDETAAAAGGTPSLRSTQTDVVKVPMAFALSELAVAPAVVPINGKATLTWTGSAEADGATVSYVLEYQPSDDGPTVSCPVSSTGPFEAKQLTRSGTINFTLTATYDVAGEDEPRTAQRQAEVTMVPLLASVAPGTVGVNGLVAVSWDAPGADHCVIDDGPRLPARGLCYVVVAASHRLVVKAVGSDGSTRERELPVVVDPTIVATEAGFTAIGAAGANATIEGQDGGPGGPIVLIVRLPPLATAGRGRVIPITALGGTGGAGGNGKAIIPYSGEPKILRAAGAGGPGGSAAVTITLDEAGEEPAQYILAQIAGGPGGAGGSYANIPGKRGRDGPAGRCSVTIDDNPVQLP
jgi:hypothetical protein